MCKHLTRLMNQEEQEITYIYIYDVHCVHSYVNDLKDKIYSVFSWLRLFNKSHIVHLFVQTLNQNLVLIKIL